MTITKRGKIMKKFKVIVPEVREEYVHVEYEIEADSIEAVKEIIEDETFWGMAEYKDYESKWGFEVKEYEFDKVEIEEIKNA
jgi:hypothetical protein